MSRRLALAVLSLVLVVAPLAACTESTRIPPAEPPSATEPLFASDEEALEAATEAYEEYLLVLDGLLQSPKIVDSDFDGIATGEALEIARDSIQQFIDDGLAITAPRRIGKAELQQVIEGAESVEVVVYFCEDVSGITLIDREGRSLTTEDRPDHATFEVTVAFTDSAALVADRSFWSNESSC